MPHPDDIRAAARRVALTTRNHEIRRGGPAFSHADLVALLPVLDAVAAGQGDEGWNAYETAKIELEDAVRDFARGGPPTRMYNARSALDAAVRRLWA